MVLWNKLADLSNSAGLTLFADLSRLEFFTKVFLHLAELNWISASGLLNFQLAGPTKAIPI